MSASEKLAAVGAQIEVLEFRLKACNEAFDELAERYRRLNERYERQRIALEHTEKSLMLERDKALCLEEECERLRMNIDERKAAKALAGDQEGA